jgi:hypothetical protein
VKYLPATSSGAPLPLSCSLTARTLSSVSGVIAEKVLIFSAMNRTRPTSNFTWPPWSPSTIHPTCSSVSFFRSDIFSSLVCSSTFRSSTFFCSSIAVFLYHAHRPGRGHGAPAPSATSY